MQNLLILYNPYYQKRVIELHLEILKREGMVAFGKIRPKSRDIEHRFSQMLERIYQSTNATNFLQLFLTDYANLFVAKVEKIDSTRGLAKAPDYYEEDDRFEVEAWFIITDLRELVRNDFQTIRDKFLPNFTTPNYNDRTFAIYGNNYVYPLIVHMKKEVDYFESAEKFYPNVFKSEDFLTCKEYLIELNFGDHAHSLHHASLDNIVYAELEYQTNKQDRLYDFSPITLRYSKILEQEIYAFMKELVVFLSQMDRSVLDISYSAQGRELSAIRDFSTKKPLGLGVYRSILFEPKIRDLLANLPGPFGFFLIKTLAPAIKTFQDIRNESAHGNKPASLQEAQTLRDKILGIKDKSVLKEMIAFKSDLKSGKIQPQKNSRRVPPDRPKQVFNGIPLGPKSSVRQLDK